MSRLQALVTYVTQTPTPPQFEAKALQKDIERLKDKIAHLTSLTVGHEEMTDWGTGKEIATEIPCLQVCRMAT